jgi:hypothetical protein
VVGGRGKSGKSVGRSGEGKGGDDDTDDGDDACGVLGSSAHGERRAQVQSRLPAYFRAEAKASAHDDNRDRIISDGQNSSVGGGSGGDRRGDADMAAGSDAKGLGKTKALATEWWSGSALSVDMSEMVVEEKRVGDDPDSEPRKGRDGGGGDEEDDIDELENQEGGDEETSAEARSMSVSLAEPVLATWAEASPDDPNCVHRGAPLGQVGAGAGSSSSSLTVGGGQLSGPTNQSVPLEVNGGGAELGWVGSERYLSTRPWRPRTLAPLDFAPTDVRPSR